MLKWDGSEIDLSKAKIREAIYHKTIYWKITWKNNRKKVKKVKNGKKKNGKKKKVEYCMVRNLNHGLLPCLIDEIKPLFGLHKIGTHWVTYESKKLLLLKVLTDNKNHIVHDLTLDHFGFHHKLVEQVRKIFVFRELLGMSKSFESSIVIRIRGYSVETISFYDPNMEPSKNNGVIPKTILEKWFQDVDIDEEIKKLVGVTSPQDLAEKLFYWRNELLKVVQRCDPEAILFIDEMLSRISSRLQHNL